LFEAVAGEVGSTGGKDAAVLDVCAEGIAAHIAHHQVSSAGTRGGVGFSNDVAHVADMVGVRAVAADHRVVACPSDQRVAIRSPTQKIVSAPAVEKIISFVSGHQVVTAIAGDRFGR
jgi:hypothetical protein